MNLAPENAASHARRRRGKLEEHKGSVCSVDSFVDRSKPAFDSRVVNRDILSLGWGRRVGVHQLGDLKLAQGA